MSSNLIVKDWFLNMGQEKNVFRKIIQITMIKFGQSQHDKVRN